MQDKTKILELHSKGLSIRAIARITNFSFSTVKRTIDKGVVSIASKTDDFDCDSMTAPKGCVKFMNLTLLPEELARLLEIRERKIATQGFVPIENIL